MKRRVCRCGFTLVELVVCLAVALLAALIILPTFQGPRCRLTRGLKDQTQVRGIMQGMVVWGQNNKDVYPLPSLVDTANATVPEAGIAKDTTSNIMSLLIFNGFVPVEMFVSPAESNSAINVMNSYQTDRPKAAADPMKALWDPAFSADFTRAAGGNVSYGHLPAHGRRAQRWTNTFTTTEAVIGNRGPEIASVTYDRRGAPSPVLANKDSNTLLIHGSRTKWEGNIGYNDNHVDFVLQPWVEKVEYAGADGKKRGDVLFYDEPDDAKAGANTLLGVFTRAGATWAEWKAIWD